MIDTLWFRLILALLILIGGGVLGFVIDHHGMTEWLIGGLTTAFMLRVMIPPEF